MRAIPNHHAIGFCPLELSQLLEYASLPQDPMIKLTIADWSTA